MKDFNKSDYNIGGSIFWILLILISMMGLSYLMIWSFHNNSIRGIVISTIFMSMIIAGVLLSRGKVFDMATWEDNALSFSLGFGLWALLGSLFSSQSVVSLQQNNLLATISSELPIFTETIINSLIVPIAEEMFWMIGIPFALISVMDAMGKKWDIWKNNILQIIVIILIGSSTFAIFHVGKMFIGFMISAIIFRSVMIVLVLGESKMDILKGVNLVASFSVGAHIANNIIDKGFGAVASIIGTNTIVSVIVILFFGVIFITALNRIFLFFVGKDNDLIANN